MMEKFSLLKILVKFQLPNSLKKGVVIDVQDEAPGPEAVLPHHGRHHQEDRHTHQAHHGLRGRVFSPNFDL